MKPLFSAMLITIGAAALLLAGCGSGGGGGGASAPTGPRVETKAEPKSTSKAPA